MRYWFDTEFIERPCTIDLVSIGIVAEDGREFYAENAWADLSRGDDWFKLNVLPHLKGGEAAQGHEEIGPAILGFIGEDTAPEFWAYYANYDWVVFCWLFGRMIDLPDGFPMFCRDLKQWAVELGDPKLPDRDSAEHHALADARWNREAWEFLADYTENPSDDPAAGLPPELADALQDPSIVVPQDRSVAELFVKRGWPLASDDDPYDAAIRLCDDDGIVRGGAMHHGTDYPCTGDAHFAGSHILCATQIHRTRPSEECERERCGGGGRIEFSIPGVPRECCRSTKPCPGCPDCTKNPSEESENG